MLDHHYSPVPVLHIFMFQLLFALGEFFFRVFIVPLGIDTLTLHTIGCPKKIPCHLERATLGSRALFWFQIWGH
jgi:hypothetical protein